MRCANCGAESVATATVCSSCGTRFPTRWRQGRRCVECGRYVPADWQLCPSCSATLPRGTSRWGPALLGLLAAAALAYNAMAYGIRLETPPEVVRWRQEASVVMSEWRERARSLLGRVELDISLPQLPTR